MRHPFLLAEARFSNERLSFVLYWNHPSKSPCSRHRPHRLGLLGGETPQKGHSSAKCSPFHLPRPYHLFLLVVVRIWNERFSFVFWLRPQHLFVLLERFSNERF